MSITPWETDGIYGHVEQADDVYFLTGVTLAPVGERPLPLPDGYLVVAVGEPGKEVSIVQKRYDGSNPFITPVHIPLEVPMRIESAKARIAVRYSDKPL
jgi:hypothetical protein